MTPHPRVLEKAKIILMGMETEIFGEPVLTEDELNKYSRQICRDVMKTHFKCVKEQLDRAKMMWQEDG